ncbi:MAG: hypothetical protein WBY71_12360 [Nitrososphaeraceae archaeon]
MWEGRVDGLLATFTLRINCWFYSFLRSSCIPVAALQHLSPKKKGFLNAFAIGILVFLIIDVFSHAWESTSTAASDAFAGKAPIEGAAFDLLAMFGGLAIGLLGLVWYETKHMKKSIKQQPLSSSAHMVAGNSGVGRGEHQQQHLLQQEVTVYRLATMIAIEIGAHNFSEGLAIGQSYVSGAIRLAILLIIGFGSHNATEGFGIAGPLTGLKKTQNPFLNIDRINRRWAYIYRYHIM